MVGSAAKYDRLGRTWRKAAWEGSTWSITETQFDELGRVKKTCNPFRTTNLTDATPGSAEWTTTDYDGISRVIKVTTPDTAHVDTYYWGNMVRVDDQATKKRISQTNALGQLTSVWEVTPSDGATVNVTFNGTVFAAYQSTYLYNGLSNLAKVTQGAQNRYFMYDSLSRLIRAKNVEQAANANIALSDSVTGNSQWSMAYSYDPNGNMETRIDARNVTTNYGYDNLNRNTSVSYNDGITPGVNRYYDQATNGIGRFYGAVSYNSHPVTGALAYSYTQVNSYDALGRVTSQTQNLLNTGGTWTPYTSTRTYNLASNVLTQTYPSNRTTTYAYNAAAQLTSFTGTLGDGVSRTYANTISYTPAGQMTKERFGTTTALYHNVHYNSRLQMVDIRLGTSSTDEWTWNRGALITYFSNQARNAGNAFLNATDNNGNVTMAEHYVPTDDAISSYSEPLRDTYEYDALNRLTQTNGLQRNTAGSWTADYAQWYSYDRYGNRTINNGSTWGAGINNLAYTISTTDNRINGVTYDAAGNVTSDPNGVTTATYDGENRMRGALKGGVQSYYVYDADGKRVRRIISGVETWQIYGIEGELVAEYPVNGAASTPQKEYGYRGGQMLIVGGCDVVRWIVADHLGTPRMEVDPSGSLTTMRRHDYLPFGEELLVGMGNGSIRTTGMGYTADCVRQRFTDKERDTETGLDFFEARYFSNTQGRFTSIDPLMASGRIMNAQSWNRYSYVLNRPLSLVDPSGLEDEDPNNPQSGRKKEEQKTDSIVTYGDVPEIVSAKSKQKGLEASVGSTFEVEYKYRINNPETSGDVNKDPGSYGKLEPVKDGNTIEGQSSPVSLIKTEVKSQRKGDVLEVTKKDTYEITSAAHSVINYQIVVSDPLATRVDRLPSSQSQMLEARENKFIYVGSDGKNKERTRERPLSIYVDSRKNRR